jgi:pimeloyl-ACP methyl ester carboxylesterase
MKTGTQASSWAVQSLFRAFPPGATGPASRPGNDTARLPGPATLQAEGFEVIAAHHGLDSHAEDVACLRRTLGRVSQPAILVGHSYGGSVITAAGTDPRVAGLVYLAAFGPDEDETIQSLQETFPPTDIFSHIAIGDGRVWLKADGIPSFAGDLSVQEQKLIWATQGAPVADLFNQKVAGTAWKSKPSWYVVATKDHTIQPELQRFVSKRMGATTFETASSHVPMLSQPEFVLDVIRQAANSIMNEKAAQSGNSHRRGSRRGFRSAAGPPNFRSLERFLAERPEEPDGGQSEHGDEVLFIAVPHKIQSWVRERSVAFVRSPSEKRAHFDRRPTGDDRLTSPLQRLVQVSGFKRLRRGKCLRWRQNPQRPVHALLGGSFQLLPHSPALPSELGAWHKYGRAAFDH